MEKELISSDFLSLDREELDLVKTKRGNQLIFPVMLKFFESERRHLTDKDIIPLDLITCLSIQLGVDIEKVDHHNWKYDGQKRFRRNIRDFLGYRECTAGDGESLISWLMEKILPEAPTQAQCLEQSYGFFRDNKTEPFSLGKVERSINSAIHRYESQFFVGAHQKISSHAKKLMDNLLKDNPEGDDEETNKIKLVHLKKDVAGAKLKNVMFELKKLACIREITLPAGLFQNVSRKFLQKYYVRILGEFASHIEEYKTENRYGMMAAFCYIRSQLLTDNLAELLIQLVNRIKRSSETHVVKKAIAEIKRVDGKFDILYTLASTSANNPDGVIKDLIYPKVSQEKLRNLAEELRCSKGKWYQDQVHTKMRSLYSHAHRQVLLPLLEAFEFQTNTALGKELLQGIEAIKRNKNCGGEFYPETEEIPFEGIISSEWRSAVLEEKTCKDYGREPGKEKDFKEESGKEELGKKISLKVTSSGETSKKPSPKTTRYKINRMNYEIAILEELCKHLRCKSVWIKGAYRYRNPDEDSPKDFDERKEFYYGLLDLPLESGVFVKALRQAMELGLQGLNDNILENPKVKIVDLKKWKKTKEARIKISPSKPQKSPVHLKMLHQAIKRRWPSTNLLDVLKETDLRIGFTELFNTIGTREALDSKKLRKRLLLCIYAIGSNAGMMRVGSANKDAHYDDLKYTKGRYLQIVNVRAAIVRVVNEIIAIRDPAIWGEATTGVACDSTQVSSWDQNLMTEWHPRYHGYGVMVYWHIDKNSAVVHSLLKTCTSSEVGSMLTGVLRHDTEMEMNEVYVDTHGQSSIGFCFSYLLHFDLLPRLKNIARQKLSYPGTKSSYANLEKILKGPIHWDLIEEHYHEVIRLTAALKMGTAEPDVIIKRFSNDNYSHPVYQAMNEIGKAVKTIFLCRYLGSEALRIEIHEALNIVERLNGIMSFIFYGKLGEISTNNKEHQELSVACLHLLQVSMVYINTLIIQEILSSPDWKNKLTDEDRRALTPLIHSHINPYGLFPLNLDERLTIEERKAA